MRAGIVGGLAPEAGAEHVEQAAALGQLAGNHRVERVTRGGQQHEVGRRERAGTVRAVGDARASAPRAPRRRRRIRGSSRRGRGTNAGSPVRTTSPRAGSTAGKRNTSGSSRRPASVTKRSTPSNVGDEARALAVDALHTRRHEDAGVDERVAERELRSLVRIIAGHFVARLVRAAQTFDSASAPRCVANRRHRLERLAAEQLLGELDAERVLEREHQVDARVRGRDRRGRGRRRRRASRCRPPGARAGDDFANSFG